MHSAVFAAACRAHSHWLLAPPQAASAGAHLVGRINALRDALHVVRRVCIASIHTLQRDTRAHGQRLAAEASFYRLAALGPPRWQASMPMTRSHVRAEPLRTRQAQQPERAAAAASSAKSAAVPQASPAPAAAAPHTRLRTRMEREAAAPVPPSAGDCPKAAASTPRRSSRRAAQCAPADDESDQDGDGGGRRPRRPRRLSGCERQVPKRRPDEGNKENIAPVRDVSLSVLAEEARIASERGTPDESIAALAGDPGLLG